MIKGENTVIKNPMFFYHFLNYKAFLMTGKLMRTKSVL